MAQGHFLLDLSLCLLTSFVVSRLLSWRVLKMHQTCQCPIYQSLLRIVGSPDGSSPDLDGVGSRPYDAQFQELPDMLGPLVQGLTDFENHVRTVSDAVGLLTSGITNVEQVVSTLCAKMVSFTEMEQNVSQLPHTDCQLPHCTHVRDRNRCSLCFKRFWLGKVVVLAWTD